MLARRLLPVLLGLGGILVVFGAQPLPGQEGKDESPKFNNPLYVPTDVEVIEKMFEMAKVTKKDVVFDLGCGDGRICALACKKFGCRSVGIDLNPVRIKECMETIDKYGVKDYVDKGLLEYRLGDALKVCDFDKATVVMLYMLPEFMDLLEPVVKERLKPGARIVSHDYTWRDKNWPPDQTVEAKGPRGTATLYMWTVRARK
jgi:cyclopropane fatty-acyl-phospholipid synthase-like methyltransferase